MSLEELYRGYGVRIHTDDIDPVKTIGGIQSYNVRDNVQVDRENTGGDIFPSITTIQSHEESYEMTSLNVDDVLDTVGTTGVCLKSNNSKTGFEFFLTALDQCQPGISSSNNNIQIQSRSSSDDVENYGLIWPGNLSIPHSGNATMSFNCTPKANGGNAAIMVNPGVVLPAIPDTNRRFGMGPVIVAGTQFIGKQSVDINFGVSILTESTDGNVFPDWVAIEKVLAVITIRGISPQWASANGIPRGGKKFAHANTTVYCRQKDTNQLSGFAAEGENKHIKITASGKAFMTDIATGNASSPTQSAFMMYVEKDGANAPLIANTLQPIT